MPYVDLRPFRPEDRDTVAGWFADAESERHAGGTRMLNDLDDGGRYNGVYIAKIEGLAVAVIAALSSNDRDALISPLVVVPGERGRGVGAAVLDALAEHPDFRELELVAYIHPDNAASLACFARASFARYRADSADVVMVRGPK